MSRHAGVEVFFGSKVQCLFCFESSTTEGRGEEMGESGNFKNKTNRTFDPRNNSTPVEFWLHKNYIPQLPSMRTCFTFANGNTKAWKTSNWQILYGRPLRAY